LRAARAGADAVEGDAVGGAAARAGDEDSAFVELHGHDGSIVAPILLARSTGETRSTRIRSASPAARSSRSSFSVPPASRQARAASTRNTAQDTASVTAQPRAVGV